MRVRRKNPGNTGHTGYKMPLVTAIEASGEGVLIRLACGHDYILHPEREKPEQYAQRMQDPAIYGRHVWVINKTRVKCEECKYTPMRLADITGERKTTFVAVQVNLARTWVEEIDGRKILRAGVNDPETGEPSPLVLTVLQQAYAPNSQLWKQKRHLLVYGQVKELPDTRVTILCERAKSVTE
jgi:hypothetical protein